MAHVYQCCLRLFEIIWIYCQQDIKPYCYLLCLACDICDGILLLLTNIDMKVNDWQPGCTI